MSIPVVVAAHLSTPTIGVDRWPMMLDAPLAWAWAERAKAAGTPLPPLTDRFAADFPLPLDRWEQSGTWGWCASQAVWNIRQYVAAQVRRKPATAAMARYGTDRKHHAGLGPTKARDTTLDAVLADRAVWHAVTTDPDELADLLAHVTNLGARHRNDFGHVTRWTITPTTDRDGWRDRPMPPDHPARAPYWHPTRRTPA